MFGKLILILGSVICLGFKNFLNNRLYLIGLIFVIFNMYEMSELVVDLWFGFVRIWFLCVYFIKFYMMRK